MSIVCPTVLADTPEDYQEQIHAIESFAERIQIDLGDGDFTTKTVELTDVQWPEHVSADIHLMYRNPQAVLDKLIALQPTMVILHVEASGNLLEVAKHLHEHDIHVGVALLQSTQVNNARELIQIADHVLLFSGSLGSFGGVADLSLLRKVSQVRAIQPDIEIGWDGGINAENIAQLVRGGVDVLNVGGAIQKALQPTNAYRELVRLASS